MKKDLTLFEKFIKVLTHQIDKSPTDAKHYDVVIVGNALSAVMTKNVVKFTHGHKTVFHNTNIRDINFNELRILYESKRIEDNDYTIGTVEAVELSVAKDTANIVKSINAKDSSIEMSSGRVVHYTSLILETGLTSAPELIPGFLEGLNQPFGKVFSSLNRTANPEFYGFFPLFEHGHAYIYIPEFPFENEVDQYNFLIALSTWELGELYGLVSPLRQLTIINANDRFASKCDVLNEYLINKLAKHPKVDVLFNTKLNKIDHKNEKLTIQDERGVVQDVDFHRIYVHCPTTANTMLQESHLLSAGKKQVQVNPLTLQHQDFENIFCYGEMIDLPIQRSLYGSLCQSQVVRHNALEYVDGRRPNAEYQNNTKLPVYTGLNSAAFYSSKNGSKPSITSNPILEKLSYYYLAGQYSRGIKKIHQSKKAGPPGRGYQKFKKGEQVREVKTEHHH